MTGPRLKGICPECGRVISGKAAGPGFVALMHHKRTTTLRRNEWCLTKGGYRRVPRIPDGGRDKNSP